MISKCMFEMCSHFHVHGRVFKASYSSFLTFKKVPGVLLFQVKTEINGLDNDYFNEYMLLNYLI